MVHNEISCTIPSVRFRALKFPKKLYFFPKKIPTDAKMRRMLRCFLIFGFIISCIETWRTANSVRQVSIQERIQPNIKKQRDMRRIFASVGIFF